MERFCYEQFLENLKSYESDMSEEEFLEHQCRRLNREPGALRGYDCPDCLNRGYIAVPRDGKVVMRRCACLGRRDVMRKLAESGIRCLHTFEEFQTNTPWREKIKRAAMDFCKREGGWFFIGGQSGCGKTHLCTAVLGAFLDRGMSGKYMLWRDDSVRLKAVVNEPEYCDEIAEFKQTDVLYIDDLFKTRAGEMPSAGDVNLAFELLNARYAGGKVTVISSERVLSQILEIDEAVGGRIYEMAKDFCINISRGKEKNWRLG